MFDSVAITLSDRIAGHAKWTPEKVALQIGEAVLTYAELDARANRVANALQSRGFGIGDRLASVVSNRLESVEVLIGATRAGGVIVPLSGMLPPDAIARMVNDSGATAVVSDVLFPDILSAIDTEVQIRWCVGGQVDGWTTYSTILRTTPDSACRVKLGPDALFNVIYSSGTTGEPKGIEHTILARHHSTVAFIAMMRLAASSVAIITTPLYTSGTWCTLLPTLAVGGRCVIMPKFDAKGFLNISELEGGTYAFLVPTQLIDILAHCKFEPAQLSSYQVIFSSGSPLLPDIKHRVRTEFPCEFLDIYGCTEGISTTLGADAPSEKLNTVGRPLWGDDIRIIGPDDQELPRGERGEIVGYGALLMCGYHNNAEATEEAKWLDERGRTYFRTGDIGMIDHDGYLTLLDRKKDVIISGGLNIYAIDVERALQEHPAVENAAVIGVPHERWGETPVAYVTLRERSPADVEEIRVHTNARLARFQRLSEVRVLETLPRNALGKVLKRELRNRYASKIDQE